MNPHERALSRGAASSLPARAASTRIAHLAIAFTCLAGALFPAQASADCRFVPDRRQLAEIEHVLARRYFRKIPRESLEVAARLCLDGRLDPYSTWFDAAQRAEFHRMLAGEVAAEPPRPPAPRDVVPPAGGTRGETGEAPFDASGGGADTFATERDDATGVFPPASETGARSALARDVAPSTRSVRGVHAEGDEAERWLADAPGRIAYVRITRFTAHTPEEMDEALAAVNRLGARGLVLDLRGDPGGLIRSAVAVTDRFLDSGTIVTVKRRKKTIVRHADREVATRVPVAVLVDGRTASAAEMMASALQDHRRAIVIGRPTYGKGAVQQVFRLKRSPGYLKLTTALYRRPSGALVEEHIPGTGGGGVRPDPGFVIAPADARDRTADPGLERALAVLRPVASAAIR